MPSTPCQVASQGVPRIWKILNSCPICAARTLLTCDTQADCQSPATYCSVSLDIQLHCTKGRYWIQALGTSYWVATVYSLRLVNYLKVAHEEGPAPLQVWP
jgi:hypothetical protein